MNEWTGLLLWNRAALSSNYTSRFCPVCLLKFVLKLLLLRLFTVNRLEMFQAELHGFIEETDVILHRRVLQLMKNVLLICLYWKYSKPRMFSIVNSNSCIVDWPWDSFGYIWSAAIVVKEIVLLLERNTLIFFSAGQFDVCRANVRLQNPLGFT